MRLVDNDFKLRNKVEEKHNNVSFLRSTNSYTINEPKKDYIKINKRTLRKKERLEKEIFKKLDLIEKEAENPNKKRPNLDKTEILDLSSINDTSIIPTISYKDYVKEKKDKKVERKESKLKLLIKKLFRKRNINKEKIDLIRQEKLKKEEQRKIELENKNKEKKLIQEKLEKERELKKQKKLEEIQKRKELKEEERLKRLEKKELEELKKTGFNVENMNGLSLEGIKTEKKLIREREKERKQEEREILRKQKLEKEEKERLIRLEERKKKEELRKEKIRKDVEMKALRKKEKDEKKMALLLEREEKKKKLDKEKNQARLERKEKAKLIKKAQEESKQKEKKERKTVEEKLKDWYNNLSFVKDRQNRREMQRQTLLIDFEGSDAVRSEEKIMYKYVAKNNETGKVETGYFSAYSKLDVHSFLIAENYEVYEITPQKNVVKQLNMFNAKFKSTELDFFLTQLSTFLKSGITLIDSVKILSKQCKKKNQKRVYKSVIYELTMGENFSEALAKQGTIFPRLLINMIKTSELTGDLPETLDDMADYYKEMEKTRKQMISAITYPAVILVFALTILIFIMVSVIPQFVSIYGDLNTELPGITVIVINLSNFLQKNWVYVVIGFVGFILVFALLLRTIKVFRTVIQSALMNMPVIGKIMIYNEVTMFTKTFASLLNHNVYITDCMEVLSKITNNEVYKMLIFDTITNLAKGEAISNSFKNHWAFPTIAYEMILTGEKTGQLGNMMDKVASYYQEQHKNAVNQIKAFIEPVLIVVLAAIVGVVLLSVVLPMFGMYNNLK